MILNRQRAVRVARRPLEMFLRRVEIEMNLGDSNVTVCLVSDAEIARLNETFRRKKGPTDVLSFPAGKKAPDATSGRKRIYTVRTGGTEKSRRKQGLPAADTYLGDVAIAPETARRHANKNGRSLSNELRVLIVHGVLHLLGYDHETDHGEMNRIEQKMRRRFGLA
ncbi:MAG TPA: rRNA maturation RNase YbeY [Candidatus Acidoferrum sp.]|nr:rRNA maturation RNase YbeY [Candidatus Acidoferrum sp.]